MTPREIVSQLDKFIIGQQDAKQAIAVAVRNRWRRQQVGEPLRSEIMPKNILMIGPTGVGKTEVARRLAKLVHAPFIKAEVTRFTQVGYVGKDVDSIIRDLTQTAYEQAHQGAVSAHKVKAEAAAEEVLLNYLRPPTQTDSNDPEAVEKARKMREKMRLKLRSGELDEKEIEIKMDVTANIQLMGPPGIEEMTSQLQEMFGNLKKNQKARKIKVKGAWSILIEQEAKKMLDEEAVKRAALANVEQNGIVFLDEFDKITHNNNSNVQGDVSREGVQRDLLPLIEGNTINTKYGNVKTDHILFIASGAFHHSKPSDLIAEMQGRLPIRVELKALSINDFVRILSEPDSSLLKQYSALLSADGVEIEWKEAGIHRLAEIAWQVNEQQENIGARRLHTVLERLLSTISFDAPDHHGDALVVSAAFVNQQLEGLAKDQDLSHYIL